MSSLRRRFIRFCFTAFYNQFAFTYDTVSKIVSRGEWRRWTRAAIPFLRGTKILEIAFGTGNLQLDLYDAGYAPVGIDLSPSMAAITQSKFPARQIVPQLARANVMALPFADDSFSSLVMTFPPGFVYNPRALSEMHRVLEPSGALVWIDAPYLVPRDTWGRFLDWAFSITGSAVPADSVLEPIFTATRENPTAPKWEWRVETVSSATSRVDVFIGTKK